MPKKKERPVYRTLRQIAEDEDFPFTVPMLRYYVLNAEHNGLAPVLRKLGKKVLFRRDLLVEWLESEPEEVGQPPE